MAVKNNAEAVGAKPGYSLSDIEELERMSIEKANKVISAIENAMAVWDASEDKPADLKPRLNRLKIVYDVLTNWERGMLKAKAKNEDLEERVERLREFNGICRTYV